MSNPQTMTAAAPAAIPTPPDFPVIWEHPDDARLFWTRDPLHLHQASPMFFSILAGPWTQGWRLAAAEMEAPMVGQRYQRVNTYVYWTFVPLVAPPEEMEARGRRCQEKLGAAMARVGELWDTEWLPEVKRHVSFWESFDLRGADTAALRAHLEESAVRFKLVTRVHGLLGYPQMFAPSLFVDLYHGLFGSQGALDPYCLLQGFDNKSLEADRALFALSREALVRPSVCTVLETCSAAEVPAVLQQSEEGRAFGAKLLLYLEEYGRRMITEEVDCPTYLEDPTPVIHTLREYLAQPDRDPMATLAELAAERERLVAEARARLHGYPQPAIDQFELLLRAAQEAMVLTEDHRFHLDYPGLYAMRRALLECGRRLAEAGVVNQTDDVFYLTLDELQDALTALPRGDHRALVRERRAEMDRFRDVTPPQVLGTLPPGPPPDDPFTRAAARFMGGPPQASPEPGVLKGAPGSGGRARGPARVIRSLDEVGKLQPGDVLVAQTTTPPWTPLFAIAAAVVTDVGGVLQHCAVVAREYRIPAVVATGVATAVLRDGQIVEVDGDAGEVRIISPA